MTDQDRALEAKLAAIDSTHRYGIDGLATWLRLAVPFAWTPQALAASHEALATCPRDATIVRSDLIEPAQWWSFPAPEIPLPQAGQLLSHLRGILVTDDQPEGTFTIVQFITMRGDDGHLIPCVASGFAAWRYGTSWTDPGSVNVSRIGLEPARNPAAAENQQLDLLGLLWHAAMGQHWLRSTVVARTGIACARAVRRRATRKQVAAADVQVITLRHADPSGSPGDVAARDYTCRWLVHPFWRNQYLPSTGGHRPTYIEAHVKGPADKPLVLRPGRGYRVSR